MLGLVPKEKDSADDDTDGSDDSDTSGKAKPLDEQPDHQESDVEGVEVEDLADALGGAVGATRAAVDAGYADPAAQIGHNGVSVQPDVYFALALSGAIQHVSGMKSSKHIIAINKDEDAPIFDLADFGVVGDVVEILPKLTSLLAQRKG